MTKKELKRLLQSAYKQGGKDALAYSTSEHLNPYHLATKHKTFNDWYDKKFPKQKKK